MTRAEFTLRTPTADDLPALFEVYAAAMSGYVRQTFGTWDEDERRREFYAGFPLDRAMVILLRDEVVGGVDMERRADCWSLNNIEIAPGWQGRGIGTALIEDLLARARAESLPVELEVYRVNHARRLYERLGFVEVGETATHILMRATLTR